MDKKRRNKIIIGIIIIIILLITLVCCSRRDPEPPPLLTPEQYILRIMKQDEAVLVSLYQVSDICSETWIESFFSLADRFKSYLNMYSGDDPEILALIEQFENCTYIYTDYNNINGNQFYNKCGKHIYNSGI